MKLKLMYVVPHLSTGGMPQFVLKRIESLQKFKNEIEIYLVEYSQFSTIYLVQRNKIIELLGKNHFFSLGSFTEKERKIELIKIIKKNNIDIVHFEEVPEGFESFNRVPLNVLNEIYNNSRTYKIVESCHNIWYDANNNKNFEPDYYCFVTPYHLDNLYNKKQSPKKVITYPLEDKVSYLYHKNKISKSEHKVPLIEKLNCREELGLDLTKTHILNVGLWTEGKNQKEGIEVARILEKTHPNLQFHFVGNRAENFEYYWGPLIQNLPSNVTIWGERNDVEKFMIASDVLMFNSLIECNPLVVRESISYGLKILTRNLSQYMGMFDNYITEIESNDYNDISNKLLELIDSKKTYTIKEEEGFGNQLFKFYNKVMDSEFVENQKLEKNYRVNQHFVVNPFIEIVGESESKFEITFYDEKNNIIYNNNLEINSWVKLNREYFTKWRTEIKENGDIVYSNILNLENKRVYISFGSKSLGDTLAWMPYCEEFRKKHNCELIVSTFLNSLFVDQYPEIEFVEPGKTVYNIYAQYQLGWFYNENEEFNQNRHPNDFKLQPLQKTATDILGLNYEEIRPKLNISEVSKKKKVGIGFHSTAQAKYWNNKNGWQEVVDYLNSCGYECMIYSKEGNGYMGNNYPKDAKVYKGGSLQEVINEFATCEFFVGLGSGLSWLAWACELPVVLISGFSEKWAETKLDTYRVINENVCHGCFNWDRLDAGDWNWCPKYKGTNRQFECSKQITSEMVINEINNIMNKEEKSVEIDEVTFDWGKKSEWYVSQATKEIFEYNIYERLFEVEEGDIVVDLGASLGPFTYSILSKNPKKCFVVEPLSYHIDILNKNVGQKNVKIIQGAISDKKKLEITWDNITETSPTFTFKEFLDDNNINKIDFLKCDCEGGEYDVFQPSNIQFLKTIPKIVVEFHLRNDENFHQCKFRWFRDNILNNFENFEVYSLDGVNIKWDLYNEHFIEYYNEVIFYFRNV
jgi:autotransporter strand-loop-strand O-heptosyltransferase